MFVVLMTVDWLSSNEKTDDTYVMNGWQIGIIWCAVPLNESSCG